MIQCRSRAIASLVLPWVVACGSSGNTNAVQGRPGDDGGALGGAGNGGNAGGSGGSGAGGTNGGTAGGGAGAAGMGRGGGSGTGGNGGGAAPAGMCTAAAAEDGAFVNLTDVQHGNTAAALGPFCDGSAIIAAKPLDPNTPFSITGRSGTSFDLPATGLWIAHVDPGGYPTWVKPILTGEIDEVQYTFLNPLNDGSVFVSGLFGTDVIFDSGGAHETQFLASGTSPEGYIARYAADGAFQWAKPLGKSIRTFILGATADPAGTAYVAVNGGTNGTTLGEEGDVGVTLAPGEAAIVAIDGSGQFLRSVKLAETQTRQMTLTVLADGGLLAAGVVATGLVLAKGTPKETAPTGTFFYARFGSDLSLDWVHTVDAPGLSPEQTAVVGLNDGSVVFGGEFQADTLTLGKGESHETTLTRQGLTRDGVVARYGSDGTLTWAVDVGSDSATTRNGTVYLRKLAATTDGSIWMSGTYDVSDDANPTGKLVVGSGSAHPHSFAVPTGAAATFMVRLGTDGTPAWGNLLVTSGYQTADALAAATHVAMAFGGFAGSGTFGSQAVSAGSEQDLYVARFGP